MNNRHVNNYVAITCADEMKDMMNGLWETAGKLMGKYVFNDLDALDNLDSEEFKDVKEVLDFYKTAMDLSVQMAKQLDQQTVIMLEMRDEIKELKNEIRYLKRNDD